MSKIPKIIPSLTGGVSQQPPALRFPGQVEACDNTWISEIEGATKRPFTEHVARLIENLPPDSSYHLIEREGEDFLLVLTPSGPSSAIPGVRVFDLTGQEITVVSEITGDTFTVPSHYIGSSPDNYVGDWETIGVAGGWFTGVIPSPILASTSLEVGPLGFSTATLVGYDIGPQPAILKHATTASFGAGSFEASVYIKRNDGLSLISVGVKDTVQDIVLEAEFEWSGSTLVVGAVPLVGASHVESIGDDWYRAVFVVDVLTEDEDDDDPTPRSGSPIDWYQLALTAAINGDQDFFWGAHLGFNDAGTIPNPLKPPLTGFGPFRYITVADSTFVLNTQFKTRVLANTSQTRTEYISNLLDEPSEVLNVGVTFKPNKNYAWSVTNDAGTLSGTIMSGRRASKGSSSSSIPPFTTSAVILALVEDIKLQGTLSGTDADVVNGRMRIRSSSPITAFSFTPVLMTANLVTIADTLMLSVQEEFIAQSYSWSITNDAGTFAGIINAGVLDTKETIASDILGQILLSSSTLDNSEVNGAIITILSETAITASAFTADRLLDFEPFIEDVSFLFVAQGIADIDYTWSITNNSGEFTGTITSGMNTETSSVAGLILTSIQDADPSLAGSIQQGSIVEVRSLSKILEFSATDDAGDSVFSAFKEEVETLAGLPVNFRDGYRIRVSSDPTTEIEDFFAVFKRTEAEGSAYGPGVWVESTDWEAVSSYDGASMPQELARKLDDEMGTITQVPFSVYFVFRPVEWITREVGNDATSKPASFTDRKLSDILFHSNRLGFLSDQNIILSEAGVFFNFWRTSNLTIADSDLVDIASNETRLNTLRTHGELGGQLILSSDHSQLALAGAPITPSTAILNKLSAFDVANITPKGIGNALIFMSNGVDFSSALEFFRVQSQSQEQGLLASEDVSVAIPKYIKGRPELLEAFPQESVYFMKAADNNILYVYRSSFSNQQRALSAWSRWVFPSNITIKFVGFTETTMVLLIEREGNLFLETMQLGDGLVDPGQQFRVLLDRRTAHTATNRVYNAADDETSITLTYDLNPALGIPGLAVATLGGIELTIKAIGTNSITVIGDHTVTPFWVGERYTQSIILSEPVPQREGPSGPIPRTGRYTVQTLEVQVADTGAFEVRTSPLGWDETFVHQITPQLIDVHGVESDAVQLQTGPHQIGIFQPAKGLIVELRNSTVLPSKFTGLVWDGTLSTHRPAL